MAGLGDTPFSGTYLNPTTPLWLSAAGASPPPANLNVSTLSVNANGGVVLTGNGTYPNGDFATISFNRGGPGAEELFMNASKGVPGRGDVESITAGTLEIAPTLFRYDDIAVRGLQVFGNQLTNYDANMGCAGYITKGSSQFSVIIDTGVLQTSNVSTNALQTSIVSTGVINASIGNFSTINVSSINGVAGGGGGGVTDPLNISTLNASTINSGNITTSTLNVSSFQIGNVLQVSSLSASTINSGNATISSLRAIDFTASTLNVSSFQLGNALQVSSLIASTLSATSANVANISSGTISTGTISAGIGNFSTLNIAGGGGITNSTINTSTVTTGVLSTTTGVIKEIFTSTMTFNASLSPNFDLGLGGIIGGLVGGFGANALGVGLGAAALGTGIAGLVMPRTSGGINPSVFQTVNGTSQLQYSTLGAVTQTTFVDTESLNPGTTPGFLRSNVAFIPAGTYCMRTVSDPLNMANSSGLAGDGIQGFSQWTPVYPGSLQVRPNSISSILTGNTISLGDTLGSGISILPAPGRSVNIQGITQISTIIVPGVANIQSLISPLINANTGNFSTLNVSTFSIGNVAFNTLTASTLNVSTANITASLQAPALINVSSINGAPYGGAIPSTFETLTTLSNTGLALAGGQIAIGNGLISVPTFAYGDVNTRGLNSISTSWMAPNPPVPVPSALTTSSTPSGSFVISELRIMWGYNFGGGTQPTVDFIPFFGGLPCFIATANTTLFNRAVSVMVRGGGMTRSNVDVYIRDSDGLGVNTGFYWLAIGPA